MLGFRHAIDVPDDGGDEVAVRHLRNDIQEHFQHRGRPLSFNKLTHLTESIVDDPDAEYYDVPSRERFWSEKQRLLGYRPKFEFFTHRMGQEDRGIGYENDPDRIPFDENDPNLEPLWNYGTALSGKLGKVFQDIKNYRDRRGKLMFYRALKRFHLVPRKFSHYYTLYADVSHLADIARHFKSMPRSKTLYVYIGLLVWDIIRRTRFFGYQKGNDFLNYLERKIDEGVQWFVNNLGTSEEWKHAFGVDRSWEQLHDALRGNQRSYSGLKAVGMYLSKWIYTAAEWLGQHTGFDTPVDDPVRSAWIARRRHYPWQSAVGPREKSFSKGYSYAKLPFGASHSSSSSYTSDNVDHLPTPAEKTQSFWSRFFGSADVDQPKL